MVKAFGWSAWALLLVVIGLPLPMMLQAQVPVVSWEPIVPRVDARTYDQYAARLGSIQVPEKRGEAGRNIDVFFIHIKSPNPNPEPPLFVLGAGPGGSGIREAQNVLSELPGVIERRDIVGMDQRGTGRSGPDLNRSFTATYQGPSDRNGLLEAYAELVRRTGRYWENQGVDLSGYNTWEAAGDIDAIRAALGYETIALFGFSYGSHLGLAVLRRIPARIDRAAFMAIESPDRTFKTPAQVQEGLEVLDRLVQADTRVSATIPSFLLLVRRVLSRLSKAPVTVQADGADGPIELTVTEWDVRKFIANRLGRRRNVESLPLLLVRMDDGDFSAVATEVLRLRRTLHVSALVGVTDCASGASPERLQLIERQRSTTVLGDLVDFPFPHICAAWNIPQLEKSYRARLVSDVPTLLVSGSLDTRTPPSNASEVAAGLANSYLLIVENEGHDVYPSEQVIEFLRTGRAPRVRTISREPLRFDPVSN